MTPTRIPCGGCIDPRLGMGSGHGEFPLIVNTSMVVNTSVVVCHPEINDYTLPPVNLAAH